MLPGFSIDNVLERVSGNSVLASHSVARGACSVSAPDLCNLVLIEGGLRTLGAAPVLSVPTKLTAQNTNSVQLVFAGRADFQVFEPIVVLDSVQMINHPVFWNWSDEEFENEAMNLKGSNFWRSSSEANDVVSVSVYTAGDDLSASADNSAPRGDLIPFPSGKVFPSFFSHAEAVA